MRIHASVATSPPRILHTRPDQPEGEVTTVNGQFILPVPPGTAVEVTAASHITPQDATSIPALIAAELLIRFPMYDHVLYDFLLEATDIVGYDLGPGVVAPTAANVTPPAPPWAALIPSPNGARCQIGRGAGPGPTGTAPGSVAILPKNTAKAAPNYGHLVTVLNDISVASPTGTDDVMMWWFITEMGTTEDILHGFGASLGLDTPALRKMYETDQEFANFYCYVSNDNGVTWYLANYLTPTDLTVAGTNIRVAFISTSLSKVYLLGWALLYKEI